MRMRSTCQADRSCHLELITSEAEFPAATGPGRDGSRSALKPSTANHDHPAAIVRRCHNPVVSDAAPATTNRTGIVTPVSTLYQRHLGVGRHRAAAKHASDSDPKTTIATALCTV